MLSNTITAALETAEAKALASTGTDGINVVPVSVITVTSSHIYLYDFFMNKTAANVQANPSVALSAWTGLAGVQVKATAEYVTEGELFSAEKAKMQEQFPERTLRGVLVLTPSQAYDISVGAEAGQTLEL